MAGKEKWTDDKVKAVFKTWSDLLPYHQENPNGRTWQEAADTLVAKTSGMMTIGNFVSQRFTTPDDLADLDFFLWPEMNSEYGTGTVEAPIDGWLMAKKPKNAEGAKELLLHFGTAAAQSASLKINPDSVASAPDVDPSIYTALQKKAQETVAAAQNVTQFLDRDTSPEFASNVAGQAFADFIADPTKIDSILSDMQDQAEAIFNQ